MSNVATSSEPAVGGSQPILTRRVIRLVVVIVTLAVAVLSVSRLNVFLAMGVENRLERACSGPNASRYERVSWTPLRWTCVIEHPDGTEEAIGPWTDSP